jgi:hypothetical protein
MYCEKLFESLDKRLNKKFTIARIALELCPTVAKPREKIISLIKVHKGGDYLIQNQVWLGFRAQHIRNPRGMIAAQDTKDKRLHKVSLNIRVPSESEYNKWISELTEICTRLQTMNDEILNSIEDRHLWRIQNMLKRTKELRMILKNKVK